MSTQGEKKKEWWPHGDRLTKIYGLTYSKGVECNCEACVKGTEKERGVSRALGCSSVE